MPHFIAEFIGTALLIVMGGGVVANVILPHTKGNGSGWIVITFGWAMAVFLGVYASTALGGGGHINPAVTLALTFFGDFPSGLVVGYIAAQLLGAFTGSIIVWIAYKPHVDAMQDPDLQLAVFSTAPAIRSPLYNFLTEVIGTFVLMLGVLVMTKPAATLGTLDALPVALLVLGIGLSLGGPTGYAINPARDLGPRIAHYILPVKNKGKSDWGYAWIPVAGPVAGALLAGLVYQLVH